MIVYEIITGEIPFLEFNLNQLTAAILKGYRPKFSQPIPFCYKNLNQKCWNENKDSRPYFRQICNQLEKNPNFITPNVNKEEYYNHIAYINTIYRNDTNEGNYQEVKNVNSPINGANTNLAHIDETEDDMTCKCFNNLNRYKKQDVMIKCNEYKICKICEKETQKQFAAFMSRRKIKRISDDEIESLPNELNIISHLNHPSLLKFVGFSQFDFKKERKSVIITEMFSNGSLEQILDLEKKMLR